MAQFKWFDGNQGVHRYFFLNRFDITNLDENGFSGEYNGEDGPIDETRQPFRFEGTFSDAVVQDPDADTLIFTSGTLSTLTWYNSNGDKLIEGTGLDTDLTLLSAMLSVDNPFAMDDFILQGDHEFVGSNDGMNSRDGWTGDEIRTGYGNDTVIARGGDDYMLDIGGADIYRGGSGEDELSYSETFWNPSLGTQGIVAKLHKNRVEGPDGQIDKVYNVERVIGTIYDDIIHGNGKDNTFVGLHGADKFYGRAGFDTVRYDRADSQGATQGVSVNLGKDTAIDSFGSTDLLRSIEGVSGSDFDDRLIDGNDNNHLRGRDGDDRLIVSRGDDTLRGDAGDDVFDFKGFNFGDDVVEDMDLGSDRIKIRKADSFDDLTIADNADGHAVITFMNSSITLQNVSATQLIDDDFIF